MEEMGLEPSSLLTASAVVVVRSDGVQGVFAGQHVNKDQVDVANCGLVGPMLAKLC